MSNTVAANYLSCFTQGRAGSFALFWLSKQVFATPESHIVWNLFFFVRGGNLLFLRISLHLDEIAYFIV